MAPPAHKQTGFANLPTGAKLLMLLVLLGVVSAAYYFGLHMSLADDIESAESQHGQLLRDRRDAERRQQEYLEIVQLLATREAIDTQNKRVLPEAAEIGAFLQDLNRLAELSGLAMRLVEPRPEEAADLYVRLPVTLRVAGRYHQVAKFFYNVSRLERAINMENVELTSPEVHGDDVVLDINVLATTFRRPTAAEVQAGQQAPEGQP